MAAPFVLVPVDFSPESRTAARLGLAVARRERAELRLLHVSSPPGAAVLSVEPVVIPAPLWDEVSGASRDVADRKLDELAEQLAPAAEDVAIRTWSLAGSVVDVIVDEASEALMIVMGSHGASGAERLFFGSVAESVSRRAPCPVLVTRADRNPPPGVFEHVVCGIDLSRFSLQLARAALRLVTDGGELELIHVITARLSAPVEVAMGITSRFDRAMEKAREDAAMRMDSLRAELGSGVKITSLVETGRVEDLLLERAAYANALVIGSHRRARLSEHVIGTTADRVLRHADVPVLLLPRVLGSDVPAPT